MNITYPVCTLIIETELGAAQQNPIHKIREAIMDPISVEAALIRMKQMKTMKQPIVAR